MEPINIWGHGIPPQSTTREVETNNRGCRGTRYTFARFYCTGIDSTKELEAENQQKRRSPTVIGFMARTEMDCSI